MSSSTVITWQTLLLASAVGGFTALVEGAHIWLFFWIIYGRRNRGRMNDSRLMALVSVMAGVIVIPVAAQLLWYSLPGNEPAGGRASASSMVAVAAAAPAPFAMRGASADKGKALFEAQNCLACHRVQGRGGSIAPDLWEVANRRDTDWILRHFKDPQGVSPGTLMPRFPLADDEFRDLAAFLLTLRSNP